MGDERRKGMEEEIRGMVNSNSRVVMEVRFSVRIMGSGI